MSESRGVPIANLVMSKVRLSVIPPEIGDERWVGPAVWTTERVVITAYQSDELHVSVSTFDGHRIGVAIKICDVLRALELSKETPDAK